MACVAEVTAAGVDTWSPSWYVEPDGPLARVLGQIATVPGKRGSMMLDAEDWPVLGYRVGWFPSGLLFAEGHPDATGGLCPASALGERLEALRAALRDVGLLVEQAGARPLAKMAGAVQSEYLAMGAGFAGFRRVDATVNLAMPSRGQGLAVLAGIAAALRSAPGKSDIYYGPDRAVESVFLLGHAGRRKLGRWYDKGLESGAAMRGLLVRGEDQRRWDKHDRRQLDELTAAGLREGFQRRFLPLYKATKGVTVAGHSVLAEKISELIDAGELTHREAESLVGHIGLVAVRGRRGAGLSLRTMYSREKRIRDFGLQLADGVLEEVEVNVADVLEQALETDAWERRG